jgi:hypothetical protein
MTAVAASSIADAEGHLVWAFGIGLVCLSFSCLCLDCAVPDPRNPNQDFLSASHGSSPRRLLRTRLSSPEWLV